MPLKKASQIALSPDLIFRQSFASPFFVHPVKGIPLMSWPQLLFPVAIYNLPSVWVSNGVSIVIQAKP
jgi:hypothetical protein